MKTTIIPLLLVATIVALAGCHDKKTPPKAIAKFTVSSDSVQIGDIIAFTNTSVNATTYSWDFGDGSSVIAQNPTHTYNSKGTFKVILTATGDDNSDTVSSKIKVRHPTTVFEGKGIKEISLGATWASVRTAFPSTDTVHYVSFSTQLGKYIHFIGFNQYGAAFYFVTATNTVSTADIVYVITVVYPYTAVTSKGISLGSLITDVTKVYGTAGVETNGDFTTYSYNKIGIDFVTSLGSTTVIEIDVYPGSNSTLKSAGLNNPLHIKDLPNWLLYKRK
jgi:PKD repeat protein